MGENGNTRGERPARRGSQARREKRTRRAFAVVIALAVAGMCCAAVVAGTGIYAYWKGEQTYNEVASLAMDTPFDDILAQEGGSDDDPSALLSSMVVDWDALLAQNADTVGWIYIPNTVINYPVVHSSDNYEYLYYNFNGQRANGTQATYGTPFLLAQNEADFSDLNNVIQAHNMANGTMFAWIGNTTLNDPDSFNQNRTAYLLTPSANYRLTAISVIVCYADDEVSRVEFSSQEDFTDFVQRLVDRSVVDFDKLSFDTQDVSRLVCLSSCSSDGTGRRSVMVCAVTGCVAMGDTETTTTTDAAAAAGE